MIATIAETVLPGITVTITRLCQSIKPLSHLLSARISKKVTKQHEGLNFPGSILRKTAGMCSQFRLI